MKEVTPVKIRQPFSRDGLGFFLRRFEWKAGRQCEKQVTRLVN